MLSRFFGKKNTQKRSGFFNRGPFSMSLHNWLTKSGAEVSYSRAMGYPVFWAAVRNISETVASLPVDIVEVKDGVHRLATLHPVYRLLHDEPNSEMTAFSFKETVQLHLLTSGNAYVWIERDGNGRAIGLWPLFPNETCPMRDKNGRLFYRTRMRHEQFDILANDMLHFANTSGNGVEGMSPLKMHLESIGLGLAAQEFGANFFGRGATMRGVIEMDKAMSPEGAERLKESWQRNYGGLGNSFGTPVLEEGMKFKQISIPPEEAQFLETRRFQIEDIARIFRIPPHLVGHLDKATFSNITEQSLEFGKYTIQPWLARWEGELNRKLLTEKEKGRFTFQFNMDELLRADPKTRSDYYDKGLKSGWLSVNEVRRRENLNPVEGGDKHLMPLNMTPIDQPFGQEEQSGASDENVENLRAFYPVFESAFERIVSAERAGCERLLKTPKDKREQKASDFMATLEDLSTRAVGPVVKSIKEQLDVPAPAAEAALTAFRSARVCNARAQLDNKTVADEENCPQAQFEQLVQNLKSWRKQDDS